MTIKDLQKQKLPDSPGVYMFKAGKKILYIGKATSLRSRVRSYFTSQIRDVRSPLIEKMVEEAKKIEVIETDSVLEALILEAYLIKKHQPVYNSKEKDDKSFNYVVITDETFPRLLTTRGKDLESQLRKTKAKYLFGPFPQGGQFKEAMKIIRKIFPYFDTKYTIEDINSSTQTKQIKFNQSIGVYPGKPEEVLNEKEYKKTIRHLKLFFEGKKKTLLSQLEKEMKQLAKKEAFEKAEEVKRKIFALTHIRDVSLIKEEFKTPQSGRIFRIEAYDIAHTSGKHVTGVMTVVVDGEVDTGEYRKFKISNDANNDTAALREILLRRFAHTEWGSPRLIVVDGGCAQLNTAQKVLDELGYVIPIVGVTKDEHHRPKGFVGDKGFVNKLEREILLANGEAHRFAISYHRKLRGKIA
ncbi:GIY-YIG nuclease family protein [Candidatus Kaiserbacteria bacterium]|nr:GIY-YIG nuclease family protein [Candidatus Kaiserbacteria bacterium]